MLPAHLGAFLAVSLLLTLSPGPDMALVLRNGLRSGPQAGWWTALGCVSGIAIYAALAVAGLSALVAASPPAFETLRLAGALYLGYLGAASLNSAYRGKGITAEKGITARNGLVSEPVDPGERPSGPGQWGAFPRSQMWRQGITSNLLNPKIAILFLTLLPQFAGTGRFRGVQTAELAVAFLILAVLWWRGFTLALVPFGRLMSKPSVQRWATAAAGVVLLGLAVDILVSAVA